MANPGPIVRYFLVAGFLIPCLLLLATYVLLGGRLEGTWAWIVLMLWPTSVFLMSAEAGGGVLGFLLAFFVSTAANILVYGLVGSLVSFCYRRFFARSASSPGRPL